MTSRRPKTKPANIDFSHEALQDCFATEPQRGQSNVAAMEKTALSSTTANLIEQVVHWGNMQKAWKAVRANHGAPGRRNHDQRLSELLLSALAQNMATTA